MFDWANEDSCTFLSRGYLLDGENVEGRVADIARAAQNILNKTPDFYQKFFDYMSKGFYSLSSPIWANFGRSRGLPISCNNSYIEDSIESLMYTTAEIGVM